MPVKGSIAHGDNIHALHGQARSQYLILGGGASKADMCMDLKVGSMIPEDLSTKRNVGSLIPLDPTTNYNSGSWIPVDLSIKFCNGSWIPQDPIINNENGSMIQTDVGSDRIRLAHYAIIIVFIDKIELKGMNPC